MPDAFDVIHVRLFLEPPDGAANGTLEAFTEHLPIHMPEYFGVEADRYMLLYGKLTRYLSVNPPPLEIIKRLPGGPEQRAFFDSQAKSPWDCCQAMLPRQPIEGVWASLLVGYGLNPRYQMEEADRKMVFLEGRLFFRKGLAHIQAEHPDCTGKDALRQALDAVSVGMMRRHGIPRERLEEIFKEGHEKWQAISGEESPSPARLSFEHQSRIYKIVLHPPLSEPVYRTEVR